MFENIRCDIGRYAGTSGDATLSLAHGLALLVQNEPLWAIAVYRFGAWARTCRVPVVRLVLSGTHHLLAAVVGTLLGIYISPAARIGRGLYIGHYGDVWIDAVTIGEFCNLSHQVTLGGPGLDVVIGQRVYVAPGAKILSSVTIGDRAAIGANAVVSRNLPESAVALGDPARIVGYQGSHAMIGAGP